MPVSLKAFISYSWTSPAFVERVRTLADRLRQDGIDVLLDQYDLGLGDDKFVYMQKSVSDPSVKKVIVLCDARYKEKFDNRQGGVGTESTMMTSDIYDQAGGNQTANNKFVAIPFSNIVTTPDGIERHLEKPEDVLPIAIRNLMYINMWTDKDLEEQYVSLLHFLTDTPQRVKPPLGKLPSFLNSPSIFLGS